MFTAIKQEIRQFINFIDEMRSELTDATYIGKINLNK